MSRRDRKPAPDQTQRNSAIAERARNVLIDTGAGTGKTTILVDRLVEMVAPTSGAPAIPIERMAAIAFTRKAAGELRLRIRERLLEELAEPALSTDRDAQLRAALAGLDTAYVGTIHSFADRLLRLRPIEAQLSPSYEIAEDDDALVRETFAVLLHAVQSGTLAFELSGTGAEDRAEEATRTLLFALAVGLPAESRDTGWQILHGLDGLVRGFIGERDVRPPDVEPAPFDAAAFRAAADEFIALARPVRGGAPGAVWLQRMASALRRVRAAAEPLVPSRSIRQLLDRMPRNPVTRRDTFGGEDAAWTLWKRFRDGDHLDPTPLRERLCGPLDRWMATRLVRLFPVVVALYEKVKARRQALDQLDLLVKLRDLLTQNLGVRGEFQQMFDHIFVDEFQDTDPLQAEIVLFLCEREPAARRWEDVELRDGGLTLVGDPKQSIYRFRRADIAMYDRVRQVVARRPHLPVTLSANFRSAPSLIAWLNDRFDRILGVAPDADHPFDAATGRVFQKRLLPGREVAAGPAVHVLPLDFPDGERHKVDEYRRLEGQTLAKYLRWLTEASGVHIEDPLEGRRRRMRYADIAILAISTWQLPLLFPSLDREGIPYASRGGTLFLSDPLHRQFLLGLRALADREDGVAEAALLRPPFFAVDPADLLEEQDAEEADSGNEAVRQVREARALVRDLRQHRFDHPPGATARDLLDRTAFARAIALGPNGAQRLARVRELCLLLEQIAAEEGLDYDAVTARLREWVNEPIQLDPPHHVGIEAVQVLTVHQAKGLEFPVVVLWDGKGQWDSRLDTGPWKMERDRRGWIMTLNGLAWEEPAGLALRATERAYLDAERCRVVYVAATRARDLLVVPRAGTVAPGKIICADLLHEADPALMVELEPYREGVGANWASTLGEPAMVPPGDGGPLEREVGVRWKAAATEGARPRFRPASVSGEADAAPRDGAVEEVGRVAAKPRVGRFGSLFGSVVHQAIGLLLRDGRLVPEEAVRRATQDTGLQEHLDEAVTDVARALEALRSEGLVRPAGPELRLEYPVAGAWQGGRLLSGYVDLVGATSDRLDVIDFKTDAPPAGPVEEAYREYAAQVRIYGRLLEAAGLRGVRQLRCGLLFTADGVIRWVVPS
jgi:ATP-dependent helicase/nuclease subunit A